MKTCTKCGGNAYTPFDTECRHDLVEDDGSTVTVWKGRSLGPSVWPPFQHGDIAVHRTEPDFIGPVEYSDTYTGIRVPGLGRLAFEAWELRLATSEEQREYRNREEATE